MCIRFCRETHENAGCVVGLVASKVAGGWANPDHHHRLERNLGRAELAASRFGLDSDEADVRSELRLQRELLSGEHACRNAGALQLKMELSSWSMFFSKS